MRSIKSFDSEQQLEQRYQQEIEAILDRAGLSEGQREALISEKMKEYKHESFEGFVRRVAAALSSRRLRQDDNQRFVEDYTRVAMAYHDAPPGQESAAFEKALREVWEERRREKAANQQKEDKGKK